MTALGAPAGDTVTAPDCWTSYSPLPAPDGTLESLASTYPGAAGSRDFYGGANPPAVAIDGVTTLGSQLISLGPLTAAAQYFKLSGALGGYSSQGDYATVTVTFQDVNGAALGSGSALSGTAAASAQLDQPEAVAANAAGDIFIADTHNNAVAEVFGAAKADTVAGPVAPASS